MAGPKLDIKITGGLVVDGTGDEPFEADVGISGSTITEVGGRVGAADEVIDAAGLVVSPGFIDIHTHLDAQVFWDPALTPSSWHGVTTVVTGNCGFGIAPTREEHRTLITRILENVEGMSADALEAGIPWDFESFPEYLDAVERTPKSINIGMLLGHTPLRLFVMGDDAHERPANTEEQSEIRRLADEALAAGALGIATSKSPNHRGVEGKPVPSRQASSEELHDLARSVGASPHGLLMVAPGPELDLPEMEGLARTAGRPVTWAAVLTGSDSISTFGGLPAGVATSLVERSASSSEELWPQISCRPLVMQTTLTDPFPLVAFCRPFEEALSTPVERRADLYADPAWRKRARDAGTTEGFWSRLSVQTTERHNDLRGRPLDELAAERGEHPLNLFVDLALDEELSTRFELKLLNDDEEEVAQLLLHEQSLLAGSDAGAHVSQLCDACYPSHLLEHWVREKQTLSIERAIWRMTGQPAAIFGLENRGRLRAGLAADVVVFDPNEVGVEQLRRVRDQPAGAERLVADSRGIAWVCVNGRVIRREGELVDSVYPGRLLRGGRG